VATTAIDTKLAVMNIVRAVTVHASFANSLHRTQGLAMTIATHDIRMRAVKKKTASNIMIEHPEIPRDRVVA
jgi:hypothetical protein